MRPTVPPASCISGKPPKSCNGEHQHGGSATIDHGYARQEGTTRETGRRERRLEEEKVHFFGLCALQEAQVQSTYVVLGNGNCSARLPFSGLYIPSPHAHQPCRSYTSCRQPCANPRNSATAPHQPARPVPPFTTRHASTIRTRTTAAKVSTKRTSTTSKRAIQPSRPLYKPFSIIPRTQLQT